MIFEYLRIRGFASLGVEIEWDTTDSCSEFAIRSSASNSGPWSIIDTVPGDINTYMVSLDDIQSGDTYLSVLATSNSGFTEEKYIYIDLNGIARSFLGAIAMGPDGVPRFLKLDNAGNLMVSGITIDSTGTGDASASLQVQQLTSLDAIKTSSQTALTSLDSILTKLSDVRINNSQIADLKNIAITNLPADYPDAAVLGAVQDINPLIPSPTTVNSILTSSQENLKTSDLSFDVSGAVETKVINFPTEFTNTDLLNSSQLIVSKTDLVIAGIQSVLSSLNANNSDTSDILLSSYNMENKADSIISSIDNGVIPELSAANAKLIGMETVMAKESTLADVVTGLADIVKSSDLPKNLAGDLLTEISNIPADFPDSASQLILVDLLTKLNTLDTSNVTISGELPAGANVLGKVEVISSELPNGAARDTSLTAIHNALVAFSGNMNASTPGSIKGLLLGLSEQLGNVLNKLDELRVPEILYQTDESVLLPIQPSSLFTTGSIENPTCGEVLISIMAESACSVKVSVSTGMEDTLYPISGFSRANIMCGKVHIIKVPTTLKNIKIDVINPSSSVEVTNLVLSVLSMPK